MVWVTAVALASRSKVKVCASQPFVLAGRVSVSALLPPPLAWSPTCQEPLRTCARVRPGALAEPSNRKPLFVAVSRPGRRTGAIMLTDATGLLTGVFTDSDLARLLETRRDRSIDGPIRNVMTRGPRTVRSGATMSEALDVLAERKISELPVIDADGRPLGMLDITDVVGLLPREGAGAESPSAAALESSEEPATVPLAG